MKPLSFIKFPRGVVVVLCVGAALPLQAWAQSVYKCVEAGKTVYQSSPCATGQGKELEIKAGPSEQEIQEARRAWENKSGAATQAPAYQPRPQAYPAARPVDCAKLNKERGDAFGRRNAANRFSRETNIDNSAAVHRSYEDIRRVERQMVQSGCKPT